MNNFLSISIITLLPSNMFALILLLCIMRGWPINIYNTWSHGLVVKADGSWSRGREFKPWHRILDGCYVDCWLLEVKKIIKNTIQYNTNLGVECGKESPVHCKNFCGVGHRRSRQFSDVTEVQDVVCARQIADRFQNWVVSGQIKVKSHYPPWVVDWHQFQIFFDSF